MRELFEFRDFEYQKSNIIDEWLKGHPIAVRDRFGDKFGYLAISPVTLWVYPDAIRLRGSYRGLWEFRIKYLREGYRLGGFLGVGEGELTLCSGWTKSMSHAARDRAMRQILDRKEMLENADARARTVRHVK